MAQSAMHKKTQFNVGDIVRVYQKIEEGSGKKDKVKTRLQYFEGMVIGIRGEGASKTFTIRRMGAGGIGIEKIFPLHLPTIDHVDVVSHGNVRRAKLYYIRNESAREIAEITKKTLKKESARLASSKVAKRSKEIKKQAAKKKKGTKTGRKTKK